jgi:arylsulfatase A-like enzyme
MHGTGLKQLQKLVVSAGRYILSGTAISASFASILYSQESIEKKDPPNIVFLFSDDHNVPDLGCYGRPVQTPFLDKFASEGIMFTRAYVTCPQSSPSRASVLTGRTPHAIGASRLHSSVEADVPNLLPWLKQKGYYTASYYRVHQPNLQKQFELVVPAADQVWDSIVDMNPFFQRIPKNRPFFLWFAPAIPRHGIGFSKSKFKGLHDPAKVIVPDFLPDILQVRKELADYHDAIAFFDAQCGHIIDLLEKYGYADNTIIVMSGDNGFDWPRGKATLYESGINVPLIIKWPGKIKSGQRSETLVTLMDLTATWLEAAGIPVPKKVEGHSLIPLFTGKDFKPHKYVFSERNWHNHWDPIRCAIGQRYKLIQNYRPEFPYEHILGYMPSWDIIKKMRAEDQLTGKLLWYKETSKTRPQVEFYDLQTDPGEWNNLVLKPEYKQLVEEYQLALSNWMNATNDFLPPPKNAFPAGTEFNNTIGNTLNGK